MTTDSFVERILNGYETLNSHRLRASERAAAREFILADVPKDAVPEVPTRKLAALILYRGLQRLTDESDEDWGNARNYKDIYDCRVCANAVAQLSVKGIMEPLAADLFGMTEMISDSDAEEAALRLFDNSKRSINPLGPQKA